jgi:hypothetical protein
MLRDRRRSSVIAAQSETPLCLSSSAPATSAFMNGSRRVRGSACVLKRTVGNLLGAVQQMKGRRRASRTIAQRAERSQYVEKRPRPGEGPGPAFHRSPAAATDGALVNAVRIDRAG